MLESKQVWNVVNKTISCIHNELREAEGEIRVHTKEEVFSITGVAYGPHNRLVKKCSMSMTIFKGVKRGRVEWMV